MNDFLAIGHRGCAAVEPENTLRALNRAIEMGCKMVEVDVWCVFGRLLVIHDESVDRTTNGVGLLSAMELSDIRGLDAGKGEKIPFLEEVMELCMGRCALNIELKSGGCEVVLQRLIGRFQSLKLVCSSFQWQWLRELHSVLSEVELAVLVGDEEKFGAACDLALELGATSVNPAITWVQRGHVRQAHQYGLAVFPYTVTHSDERKFLIGIKANGGFVDDPRIFFDA